MLFKASSEHKDPIERMLVEAAAVAAALAVEAFPERELQHRDIAYMIRTEKQLR